MVVTSSQNLFLRIFGVLRGAGHIFCRMALSGDLSDAFL